MSEKTTSLPPSSMVGILGIFSGAAANIFLLVPGIGLGAIVSGVIGFVLSFIGLGMAKKAEKPDMKFIIPGLILNLVALGLGIYFRWFIVADTAPEADLRFLDSLKQ